MEGLSAKLQEIIESRPLKTLVDTEDTKSNTGWRDSIFVHYVSNDIPRVFDGRIVWKNYLSKIGNQGKCGSCWAWASSSALADRFAIMSQGKIKISLSPLYLLVCDIQSILNSPSDATIFDISSIPGNSNENQLTLLLSKGIGKVGCHGNTLLDVWKWLYLRGTSTDECLSYISKKGDEFISITNYQEDNQLPLCTQVSGPSADMCGDFYIEQDTGLQLGNPARFFRAICYYTIPGTVDQMGSQLNIMSEILCNGPVTTGMRVYPDFYDFDAKNDVYSAQEGQQRVGGHAIKIVGWGETTEKEKYWIIANSWGTNWGRDGYFYMKRGVDMCGIESNVSCGIPDMFYPSGAIFPSQIYRYISVIPEEDATVRLKIDYGAIESFVAGGIDPRIGYYRRALYAYTGYPWKHLNTMNDVMKMLTNPRYAYQNRSSTIENFAIGFEKMKPEEIFVIIWLFLVFICIFIMCLNSTNSKSN